MAQKTPAAKFAADTVRCYRQSVLTRRSLLKLGSLAAASAVVPRPARSLDKADYSLEIAPYTLEISARHSIKTTAYNGQVPGPLLRLREGKPVTIDVTNHSENEELVHWHGLFLPPNVDGAMEEGTAMIPPGGHARYTFTPAPSGFRWYLRRRRPEKVDLHRPAWVSDDRFCCKSWPIRSGVLPRPA